MDGYSLIIEFQTERLLNRLTPPVIVLGFAFINRGNRVRLAWMNQVFSEPGRLDDESPNPH